MNTLQEVSVDMSLTEVAYPMRAGGKTYTSSWHFHILIA